MSDLAEKLAVPVVRFDKGRARQTLAQLRKRWGYPGDLGAGPQVITIGVAHATGREVWVRLEDGSRGEQQNYELEGEP